MTRIVLSCHDVTMLHEMTRDPLKEPKSHLLTFTNCREGEAHCDVCDRTFTLETLLEQPECQG